MNPTAAQYTSVKHTVIHPNFLHTNSTSHRWAFSAIAELIDNACDDAQATQFCIDMQQFDVTAEDGTTKYVDTLVFMDNGMGMDPLQLHKMLGFGHSDKASNARAIGRFGNGFKAGSMRLGKDALVLTKCARSQSAGFLSQSFLKATGCDDILVPMVSWDLEGKRLNNNRADTEQSLHAINRFSIFQDEESLLAQLAAMPDTGTIVIISGLRRDEAGALELDFDTDTNDIRIARDIAYGNEEKGMENFQQMRSGQARSTDVKLDYSLRQYVSVLYKVPHMQIFVREHKVRTQRVTSLLRSKLHERFTPRNTAPGVYADIEMGFNTEDPSLYGMMIYHRNRLIRPYHRVGMQLEANEKGVGVLGVVQADYLEPTHNKQDFNDTAAYRALQNKLADILKIYWWDKVEKNAVPKPLALPSTAPLGRINHLSEQPGVQQNGSSTAAATAAAASAPDDFWVQCDEPSCLKWRKMPPGWTLQQVEAAQEDGSWYCRLNPDAAAAAAGCEMPEEAYMAPQSAAADTRVVKKRYNEAKEQEKTAKRKKRESEETERRRLEAERAQEARQAANRQLMAEMAKVQLQQHQQQMRAQRQRNSVYQQQHEQLRQAGMLRTQHGADPQQLQPSKGRGVGSAVPASASPSSMASAAMTLPLSSAELATIRTGLAPALLAPALQSGAAAAAPPMPAAAPEVPALAAARAAAGPASSPAAPAVQAPAAPAATAAAPAIPTSTAAAPVAGQTAATPVTTALTTAAAPATTAAAATAASAPAAGPARPATPAAATPEVSTPQWPATRASGRAADTSGVASAPGAGSTRGTPPGPTIQRVAHADLAPALAASAEPKVQRAAHADYQKRQHIDADIDLTESSPQPADKPATDQEAPAASAPAGRAVIKVEEQLESTPSARPTAAATPMQASEPIEKEASAGPNSASTEQAVPSPAAVARSTEPAATAQLNSSAQLSEPAAAGAAAGLAGDGALAQRFARQQAEAAELLSKLQVKVAGLEKSLQGTHATLNALSVNMRKVLTALLTQSMGANANLARHFEQLGPEQLAKFDVDVFCRNLAPARKN
ncbi:g8688 [Coccomyxa elongata]